MIPIEYIASGEHTIVIGQERTLKLLLGSCVGIVIYDRVVGIGGAAHFILPEPATPNSDWMPDNYVTTGLLHFIHALQQAGANPDRLEAVLAGGALFGKISEHDLALNIGGRCVENAHAILKERQIPIVKEESCGFSPYIMTLNTATWHTEITTRFKIDPDGEPIKKPTRQDIIQAINDITPIPQTALKVIHLISEGEYDTSELVDTIGSDQVLTGKILSLCNSALVAPRHPIETLAKAVLILGQENLLQMVATAAFSSLLKVQNGGYALIKGGLYKHAIGTAYSARIIAEETRLVKPDAAYSAGLLHDIGKVVLDRYFASFRPLFYQHNQPGETVLSSFENQFLGIDHQEAGKLLTDEWDLPESIAQVIAHHHQPDQASSHHDLTHLVYLADFLTSWYLSGYESELISSEPLVSSLERLGISKTELPALIDKIPWRAIMYL
ncbi:MAG: HDOD domain-containing protein [Proteobacteria bacterium]|nr:HDOD domain-containing protein [Desulfobulbaceae bacterium]MBU4153730.1 HDOD domain-containing protein [Pseudomonadota bacterium]